MGTTGTTGTNGLAHRSHERSAYSAKVGTHGGQSGRMVALRCARIVATPHMHRPLIGLLASSLIATGAVLAAQQSAQPAQTTFKSGVDLILIEATVLDKDGRPIADLRAKEFSIKIGGKARTIAAAEYIPAGRAVVEAPTPGQDAPATTPTTRPETSVGTARAQRTRLVPGDA